MSIEDWVGKLESLQPDKIEMGLDRVACVARDLDLTKPAPKVVTIAGTNGKGSTQCILAHILKSAGYRVGAYSSPHLIHFNERIQVNAEPITDADLCASLERVEAARMGTMLTYFEFTTLAALDYFSTFDLDVLLLEVGLGGRLDAVNLLDSDIAVITTIALDHQSWLGTDREQIGFEKSGIFRPGRPAVCGDVRVPQSVLQRADEAGAKLYSRGNQFDCQLSVETGGELSWQWQGMNNERTICFTGLPLPELNLANAATALQVIALLGVDVERYAIEVGLKEASLPGRYQRVMAPVPTILDVAHNPEAVMSLAMRLDSEPVTGKKHALLGILDDKDCEAIINIMAPKIDSWTLCEPDTPRAKSVETLAKYLSRCHNQINVCRDVGEALNGLYQNLRENDLLVVFGSFYTVAQTLQYLAAREIR